VADNGLIINLYRGKKIYETSELIYSIEQRALEVLERVRTCAEPT
jgi:hypothetical protein